MRQSARTLIAPLGFLLALWAFGFGSISSVGHACEAQNMDLERFLPNHGNSVFNATGLLRKWPSGGPKELWRVEIGWGKAAVVEAGGRAFTAT
ncbi:MAG: hypothetical protein ACYSX1_06560, partial [Planctomycetota bacterium]